MGSGLQSSSGNSIGSEMAWLLSLTDSELQNLIPQLTIQEQDELLTEISNHDARLCSESLDYFASHIKTKDEHADGSQSVRTFPSRETKPYLWRFFDLAQLHPVLLIEKSRQLMLTWGVCLLALWVAKYQANRLIMIQSKKFEDAAALVYSKEPTIARISFMEASLPAELRSCDMSKAREGYLLFSSGSQIQAIPEGGDQIRSRTPSLVISDEFAFQPEAESAWKSIKPLVDSKGGRFIGISSACGGAYMSQLIAR